MACCGYLRAKCFIIGYLNLIVCIVDIGVHVLIAAIVSNGFQCDVDSDSLRAVDWPWLESVLPMINIGTHGFYPFPLITRSSDCQLGYMPPREPRCYPGMLHVYLIDILNLLINVIWLKFVLSFVAAVHRKDPEPMRMFFSISLIKFLLQVLNFVYQPGFYKGFHPDSLMKSLDTIVAGVFLLIIIQYTFYLKTQNASPKTEQPPPYVECLIDLQNTAQDKNKANEANLTPISTSDEKIIDMPTETKLQA